MAGKPVAVPGEANRALMACLLAGRPVVQLRDLAEEAGLGRDYYDEGRIYMELHHAERLMDAGYRPILVPALSGAVSIVVFVRGPWAADAAAEAVPAAMLPYLADGAPLMALLVSRALRSSEESAKH